MPRIALRHCLLFVFAALAGFQLGAHPKGALSARQNALAAQTGSGPVSVPAPPPGMAPAPGSPEAGAEATDAIVASLTPAIPAGALPIEALHALVAQLTGGEAGGRIAGVSDAAMERIVRARWPAAEKREVKLTYRDVTRFTVQIDYSSGMATPQAFPFFFSGMPAGELKLKYLQFSGADLSAPPDRDKAAQSLFIVALPEKLKAAEANARVADLLAQAEKLGAGALCIAGASEAPEFDFGFITTSAHLPFAAENDIDAAKRLQRFAGMPAYLAARQVGWTGGVRKLPVFYTPISNWNSLTENPRNPKLVKVSRLALQGSADAKILVTNNFLLRVAGSNPVRAGQWIHLSTEWDGRAGGPGASAAAAAAGVLMLGDYFSKHPAPRSMLFSLLGGGSWGSAGAEELLRDFPPAGENIYWNLTVPALGRIEDVDATGAIVPKRLLYLAGWSRSKKTQGDWKTITPAFTEILNQYDLAGQWLDKVETDRAITELTGLHGRLVKARRAGAGTVLTLLGANPAVIHQPGDTPDKLNYELLAAQIRACGHFAQKLASPA